MERFGKKCSNQRFVSILIGWMLTLGWEGSVQCDSFLFVFLCFFSLKHLFIAAVLTVQVVQAVIITYLVGT